MIEKTPLKKAGALGVAVVGLGVGREHALTYRRHPRSDLRLIYDRDVLRAREVARELEPISLVESFDAILEDRTVDVVSIASYDDAHAEQVVRALKSGKHVFVEKPLCQTMEELSGIDRVWRENQNLHLHSNLVLRAAPLYRWLRQAVRSGELGQIYAFDGDYLYGRLHKITEGWRKNVENYSVVLGGGIHLVDLMIWLTGEKPVSVNAIGNQICTQGGAFRYNDHVSASYQFPSGMIGRISANFGCVHRHQHVVRLFGTKATFLYDDMGPRLHTSRDPSSTLKFPDLAPKPVTKGELIPDFIDSILDLRESEAKNEFDLISACVATDQSLVSGENLKVRYL